VGGDAVEKTTSRTMLRGHCVYYGSLRETVQLEEYEVRARAKNQYKNLPRRDKTFFAAEEVHSSM